MVRIALCILLVLHGLIHLMGFVKAYNLARVHRLHQPVTKTNGILWLMATLLFVSSAVIVALNVDWWWIPAAVAIVVSQYLVITSWQDAKFGTIANVVLLVAVVIGYATWSYARTYKHEVTSALQAEPAQRSTATSMQTSSADMSGTNILSESDIQHLPPPVQKYIRYSGALGKEKVRTFRATFDGQFKQDSSSDWMPLLSEQYNIIKPAARLFFMKVTMFGLPVTGFHCFKNGKASMDIRLASLVRVQYQDGPKMDTAETVTLFNDMCLLAPATLIDNRIEWGDASGDTVNAVFTNNGIRISATLYFSALGQLVNFKSGNRYALQGDSSSRIPWSTPAKDYRTINGHQLSSSAEVVYHYDKGDFVYGRFHLTSVEYNVGVQY
ncbi:MAG: DUF6544 family protein [bacterium]|nr:DUF6544 family protein [bacterium]